LICRQSRIGRQVIRIFPCDGHRDGSGRRRRPVALGQDVEPPVAGADPEPVRDREGRGHVEEDAAAGVGGQEGVHGLERAAAVVDVEDVVVGAAQEGAGRGAAARELERRRGAGGRVPVQATQPERVGYGQVPASCRRAAGVCGGGIDGCALVQQGGQYWQQ
jgi:hypothetical protein